MILAVARRVRDMEEEGRMIQNQHIVKRRFGIVKKDCKHSHGCISSGFRRHGWIASCCLLRPGGDSHRCAALTVEETANLQGSDGEIFAGQGERRAVVQEEV